MKTINIPGFKYSPEQIGMIAKTFLQGGVVIYPTDTVYGIGCLANDKQAQNRIYNIKQRDRAKPFLILVSDLVMAQKYFQINSRQLNYLKKYWPGPTSFLLKVSKNSDMDTSEALVVRLPKNDFLTKLIEEVGFPITSTSLNISGKEVLAKLEDLGSYFNLSKIDLAVDAGLLPGKPSSIIDLREIDNIKIIRK